MAQDLVRARKQLPVAQLAARPEPAGSGQKKAYAGYSTQEETIDAEWWYEDASKTSGWQQKWNQAKAFFDTASGRKAKAQRAEREALIDELNEKSEFLSEADQLKLMGENTRLANEAYMESLRKSNILAPGFNDAERGEKLSLLQKVHGQMMVSACVAPMRNGVNVNSVAQMASSMAVLYMFSPTFRETSKEYLEPLKQWRSNKLADSARKKLERVEQGQWVMPGAKKRMTEVAAAERGHREVYTVESAALTEVGLAEQAQLRLMEPKADREQIMDSYRQMVQHLYQQVEDDGLDRDEVAGRSREVLAERIRHEPRLQSMVDGLSHGQGHVSDRDGTQFETYQGEPIVMGRFRDQEKRDEAISGFTLRGPMSAAEHQELMAKTMAVSMNEAVARGDMEAFNQDMAGYMLGYTAQARDFDGEKCPGNVSSRLFQSRTMLASMSVDGFSESARRDLYANAYIDAIEMVHEVHPDLQAGWEKTYGEQWRSFLKDAVQDPQAAYAQWQADAGGPAAGAKPGAQQSRSAGDRWRQASDPEPEYEP